MKPWIHAKSSAKLFGGEPKDYLKIHDWFDQTKSHVGNNTHRAILHSSFGIFLCEQVFGHYINNSRNEMVCVRDIGEQHVVEDLGFIPTVCDYLENLEYQPWMSREAGAEPPSSQREIIRYKKEQHLKDSLSLIDNPNPKKALDKIKKRAKIMI